MRIDLDFICRSTGGRILNGCGEKIISAVITDSRKVTTGSLFVALQGKNYDGHDFVLDALRKGAAAAVISRKINIECNELKDKAMVLVDDTLKALQDLALNYRQQFAIPIVAVTGSVGKTTTKDIIARCLDSTFKTLKTTGNYNNDIGVPLTIFQLEQGHQAAVIEMAMRGRGEIERLARIVKPTCAVITNVEPVHLETLGSIENIARAKCEVLSELNNNSVALLNGDNEILLEAAGEYTCRKYTFGYNRDCDFRIINVNTKQNGMEIKAKFADKIHDIYFPIPSPQLAGNVIAALAAAYLLGVDCDKALESLSSFIPSGNRLNIIRLDEGGVIINDTYNANPVSMAAVLETGQELRGNGKLVAVLGDMFELGEYEISGHMEVGIKAAQTGVDVLVTVGERARYIGEGAKEAGMNAENIHHFDSKEACIDFLRGNFSKNDTVLFKASRGMQFETLVEAWRNE